jgi:hypothetical protein
MAFNTIFLKNRIREIISPGRSRRDTMNHEEVLAVLSDSREEAKSIKEIARAMGWGISSYVDWVRAERRLVRALGALMKLGWVARGERQKEAGHGF